VLLNSNGVALRVAAKVLELAIALSSDLIEIDVDIGYVTKAETRGASESR
jgi:hypothetical protein